MGKLWNCFARLIIDSPRSPCVLCGIFNFIFWSIFWRWSLFVNCSIGEFLKQNVIPENDLLLIAYILCHESMVELCTNSNLFRRKIDLKFKSYIMPVLPCMKSPKNTTPHRFSRVCRWEITFRRCLSLTFFLNGKKWIIVHRSKDVGKLFNVRHITS